MFRTYNSFSGVRTKVASKKLYEEYREKQMSSLSNYNVGTGTLCLNEARKVQRPRHLKRVVNISLM